MPDREKAITAARSSLGLRVVSDFDTLLGDAGASDLFVKKDTLRVFDTEAQFNAEAHERAVKAEHGYEAKTVSREEISEIEPALARDFYCGAFHGGWYFVRDPRKVVAAIAESVERNGGDIIADDVTAIANNGRRATTITLRERGQRSLDKLVICAGAYSGILVSQIGEHVLLEAERGYHLMMPEPGFELGRSITYAGNPMGMTPMDGGLRLAGTDEFAGLDAPPNWKRADILWKDAKRCFPDLRPIDDNVSRWMGRRPGTPDSLPVIGPSSKLANVWYGFGHSHMGLTWGPTSGRLISELMTGVKSNIDLKPFSITRFA